MTGQPMSGKKPPPGLPREIFYNPAARSGELPAPARAPLRLHRRMPGYAPTPLREAPALAALLGVGRVLVKDESWRLGLPAFKILGAAWAAYNAISAAGDLDPEPWQTVDELAARLAPLRPLTLVAATDGNHGRAVARVARMLGLSAHILVPTGTAAARVAAIESESARCSVVDGTYEDAVAASRDELSATRLVITDVGWDGYQDVPGWAVEGYSTIFWEVDAQLSVAGGRGAGTGTGTGGARGGGPAPVRPAPVHPGPVRAVAVPVGAGALAAATLRHYRRAGLADPPHVIGVEPLSAACMLASLRAGRITTVPGPHRSIMAGCNCGEPAALGWASASAALDCVVAIHDDAARAAMRALAACGITAGETGSAGLAGVTELLAGPDAASWRDRLGLTAGATLLLVCTEGATDPDGYREIVGSPQPAGTSHHLPTAHPLAGHPLGHPKPSSEDAT